MTSSSAPPPADRLVIRASEVTSRSIRWAWSGRLARGYLAVWTGVEGLGKSVFAAWVIARLTRGELEGQWRGAPITCLVVAGEDGIADTWRPRLELAGADLDRVGFLNLDELGPDWNLRDGIEQLRAAVREVDAQLIYIDAALDHMPNPKAGEGVNSATFVRAALGPLKRLARDHDIPVLFSMHPPKGKSADYRDLVQASQAFSAIPRIGLLFAYHPDDPEDAEDRRRVLLRGKGNLGDAENRDAAPAPGRLCAICGASLDGRRAHARYCSGACRAEASRLRRIVAGQEPDGFRTLADRLRRQRNRTEPGAGAQNGCPT